METRIIMVYQYNKTDKFAIRKGFVTDIAKVPISIQILELIFFVVCECCGKRKKKTGPKTGKPYRQGDLGQGERSTLVVVAPPAPRSTPAPQTRGSSAPPPPNYQVRVMINEMSKQS